MNVTNAEKISKKIFNIVAPLVFNQVCYKNIKMAEKVYITKFGEVNSIIWKIESLTYDQKKDLIDRIGNTILEAMEESHRDIKESILKIYK